jgi:SAM-dependent methyltransferase
MGLDYTRNAIAQQLSAKKVRTYCSKHSPAPHRILDIGCGNGHETLALASEYPNATITAIDINPDRIKEAAQNHSAPTIHYQHSSLRDHARATEKYDIITSNAALHWITEIDLLPSLLTNQGHLIFSYYTNETFKDLQDTLSTYYKNPVTLSAQQFRPFSEIKDLLSQELGLIESSKEIITLEFNTMIDLLRHIRNTGTKGTPIIPNNSPWTPKMIKTIEALYIKKYGKIRLSYDIIISVWKDKK